VRLYSSCLRSLVLAGPSLVSLDALLETVRASDPSGCSYLRETDGPSCTCWRQCWCRGPACRRESSTCHGPTIVISQQFAQKAPGSMRRFSAQTAGRLHGIATTSFPAICPSSSVEATHLLPSPQAIVLLEFALVVRYTVLAVDPAGDCQCRRSCRKTGSQRWPSQAEHRCAKMSMAAK
jgi:hypothetical protein